MKQIDPTNVFTAIEHTKSLVILNSTSDHILVKNLSNVHSVAEASSLQECSKHMFGHTLD